MKKILIIILCCLSMIYIHSMVQAQHTNVPRIEDRPKTTVPRLPDEDEPPLKDPYGEKTVHKPKSWTEVPMLTDADELLDITIPMEIKDPSFPDAKRPSAPNAAQKIHDKAYEVKSTFAFTKKFSFQMSLNGKKYNSYFYLNTDNGHAMMDEQAVKLLGISTNDMKSTWVKDAFDNMYTYITASNKKYAYKISSTNEAVAHDFASEILIKDFFKNFKPNGKFSKKNIDGHHYVSKAYQGFSDGKPTVVWLADAQDIKIDVNVASYINGFFGLGYIANTRGVTYLVTGYEQGKNSIILSSISNEKKAFNGASYESIGSQISSEHSVNEDQMASLERALAAEKDPERRKLIQVSIDKAKSFNNHLQNNGTDGFRNTSDVSPYTQDAMSTAHQIDYFRMYKNKLIEDEKELQEGLIELKKYGGNTDAIDKMNCAIKCNQAAQGRAAYYELKEKDAKERFKDDSPMFIEVWNKILEDFNNEVKATCNC